jgi:superfamily II DNA/RNA helicase
MNDNEWTKLGLWSNISSSIIHELQYPSPTMVQQLVIPRILSSQLNNDRSSHNTSNNNNKSIGNTSYSSLAFLAATVRKPQMIFKYTIQAFIKPTRNNGGSQSFPCVCVCVFVCVYSLLVFFFILLF